MTHRSDGGHLRDVGDVAGRGRNGRQPTSQLTEPER